MHAARAQGEKNAVAEEWRIIVLGACPRVACVCSPVRLAKSPEPTEDLDTADSTTLDSDACPAVHRRPISPHPLAVAPERPQEAYAFESCCQPYQPRVRALHLDRDRSWRTGHGEIPQPTRIHLLPCLRASVPLVTRL